jgi:uncharacterized membrane protein
MKLIALTYLATLVTLGLLDLAYLGSVGVKLFKQQLGPGVLRQKPVAAAAVLFYLLYAAGVTYFAVLTNANQGILAHALRGALLGLLAYGTYDLTNMATLAKWTWVLVILDMLWGIIVTALAAAAGAYVLGLVS